MLYEVAGILFSSSLKLILAGDGIILLFLEEVRSIVFFIAFSIVSIELIKLHLIASKPFDIGWELSEKTNGK